MVYVRNDIKAKQLSHLELEDFSDIWLEVGLPYSKKKILGSVYREHNHLRVNPNNENNHHSSERQEDRW